MSGNGNIRNIGVFAHVDAGKTTLTEKLLRRAGAIREAGSVDSGTAHTDRMDIERRRGISVRFTCAQLLWNGVVINLIDTPGHADFAAEVERSLWALDGAVLLIDAVEGVQPQAEALFHALAELHMPTLFFINKTDRDGADCALALAHIRSLLTPRAFDYTSDDALHACLADHDEEALLSYMEGDIFPREQMLPGIRRLVSDGIAYPVLTGSALRDIGTDRLLDATVDLLPPPRGSADGPLSGVVFAIEHDKMLGRAAHVRLFTGTLENRNTVPLPAQGKTAEAKVTQIRSIPLDGKGQDLGIIRAGEIGAVYGLGDVRVGQIIGDGALLPRRIATGDLNTPLLMAKALPIHPDEKSALRAALMQLTKEDPLLGAEELEGDLHIRVMGQVQLEVLAEIIPARFGVGVAFGEPNVIYRETIRESAVGFYAYTMPKPCWAVIKFQIDPLPRGSGVQFDSVVPVREIMQRYQHQVRQAIPLATAQGMLGWQMDDVRITLIGGEHHLIHTHPLDFIVATPIAFMDGLRRGGSVLLEPILEMRLTAPEGCASKLLGEIIAMRGELITSDSKADRIILTAHVPLAASIDFPIRFQALTGGRGAMSVRLNGYKACPTELGRTCPRRNVHPLDTAKYILAARSALDGGIFDV